MLFYGSIVMLNCRNYTGDDIKKGTHYKPKQLVCLQILEMQTMFVYNSYKPPLKGKKIIKKVNFPSLGRRKSCRFFLRLMHHKSAVLKVRTPLAF